MDVSKVLASHLECPICTNVPRYGVMLMCLNGHSVCAVCLSKLGADAKCPMGRCDFGTPPTKNFVVEDLVQNFFRWACQFRKAADCKFEGTGVELETHETACRQQLIHCPDSLCEELVSLATVVKHCYDAHSMSARSCISNKGNWYSCFIETTNKAVRSLLFSR